MQRSSSRASSGPASSAKRGPTEQLRAAGIPGVRAVWCPPELGNRLLVVIAIEQAHPGHATQAGLVGGQIAATVYGGRFVVVVDHDVDVFALDEVLWALATRCDPARDSQFVTGAWSSRLDLAVPRDERGRNSRLILDATRPWERRDEFPEPTRTRERTQAIRDARVVRREAAGRQRRERMADRIEERHAQRWAWLIPYS